MRTPQKNIRRPANLEQRPVDALIPYARNSRTHSDGQVAQIAASIKEFGFTNPVLVDGEGVIIAGHGRVLAARKLNMAEVPCLVLDYLTESQRRAYVIADNKLAMNAGWDDEMLRVEVDALLADGFDVDLLGFTGDELTALQGSEVMPFGAEDTDESASGVRTIYLKVDKVSLPMTENEALRMAALVAQYTEESGVLHGFAGWLLGRLHA